MSKPMTFPYLFDEEKTISTIKLKEWGYLKEGIHQTGTVTWKRNGEIRSSIRITITMNHPVHRLYLDYKWQEQKMYYHVNLTAVKSNLGKGKIWYFLCPTTGIRCRKLHLINGKFQHRSTLPSGLYSKQCHSKNWRGIEKVYGCYFDQDKNYEQMYKKHFKKYYNGKPTKKYKKLRAEIDKAKRFSAADIQALFLK